MAQPIKATPTLVGKEAIAFLERMKRNNTSKPNKADKKLIKLMQENRVLFASV